MFVPRRGFGKLLFVVSDCLDMLARNRWEDVSESGMHALQDRGFWHVADLHQLRLVAWSISSGHHRRGGAARSTTLVGFAISETTMASASPLAHGPGGAVSRSLLNRESARRPRCASSP